MTGIPLDQILHPENRLTLNAQVGGLGIDILNRLCFTKLDTYGITAALITFGHFVTLGIDTDRPKWTYRHTCLTAHA
jgi:hypothetical protein